MLLYGEENKIESFDRQKPWYIAMIILLDSICIMEEYNSIYQQFYDRFYFLDTQVIHNFLLLKLRIKNCKAENFLII